MKITIHLPDDQIKEILSLSKNVSYDEIKNDTEKYNEIVQYLVDETMDKFFYIERFDTDTVTEIVDSVFEI